MGSEMRRLTLSPVITHDIAINIKQLVKLPHHLSEYLGGNVSDASTSLRHVHINVFMICVAYDTLRWHHSPMASTSSMFEWRSADTLLRRIPGGRAKLNSFAEESAPSAFDLLERERFGSGSKAKVKRRSTLSTVTYCRKEDQQQEPGKTRKNNWNDAMMRKSPRDPWNAWILCVNATGFSFFKRCWRPQDVSPKNTRGGGHMKAEQTKLFLWMTSNPIQRKVSGMSISWMKALWYAMLSNERRAIARTQAESLKLKLPPFSPYFFFEVSVMLHGEKPYTEK